MLAPAAPQALHQRPSGGSDSAYARWRRVHPCRRPHPRAAAACPHGDPREQRHIGISYAGYSEREKTVEKDGRWLLVVFSFFSSFLQPASGEQSYILLGLLFLILVVYV